MIDARTSLKLALNALDRAEPNTQLAIELLREVVGTELGTPVRPQKRAVKIAEAAKVMSMSTKTIRARIKGGTIPAIGSGRSVRVLIDDALDPKLETTTANDETSTAGAAWAASTGRLRVVNGGTR